MSSGFLNPLLIQDAVRRALDEDLGRAGDITTQATIPASSIAPTVIAARETGVIAGLPLAEAAFHMIAQGIRFTPRLGDGTLVQAGDVIAEIEGSARAILSAERVALNFLGRMSGIASLTQRYVDAVSGTEACIVCTRKTTPGLRAFEKYAVRCGETRDRHAIGRAGDIIETHLVAEGHRGRITPMFAANTELDIRTGLATTLDTDAHQFTNPVPINCHERIRGQNALSRVSAQEAGRVIA